MGKQRIGAATLAALLLAWGVAWGAGGGSPFVQLLEQALAANPQVLTAQAKLAAAEERRQQAKAALLPTVSLQADQRHQRDEWDGGRNAQDPAKVGLTLSQPLYNQQAIEGFRQVEPYIASFRHDLEAARQRVALAVAEVSSGWLEAQEVAELAANNQKVAESHRDSTEARYQAGELTRTDVSQAKARVATARAARIEADNAVAVRRARFLETVGRPPPDKLTLPRAGKEIDRQALADLLNSIEDRPDVKAARSRLRVAEINVDLERAGHLPVVALSSTADRNWGGEITGRPDPSNQYTLKLGMTVPLYSGGTTVSKTEQARADRNAATAELDRALRESNREVEQYYLDLQSAKVAAEAFAAAAKAAKEAAQGVEEEFKVGARTALDLLDAQKELFTAETDLAKSRHALGLARFQLLRAVGRLTVEMVEEP
ncbi:MAG: TolC family outer membrane protein [Magnetococcales bacterium]|nr:TolC family outer membrane protein [Magnetococcales bacterium]